ncbi:ABC transporter substrate-binding protein [Roseomonas sp. NAR14]|uniref:ABC transporter substrate-binding protein n=1 Tax=Roseomonas acroporae TaxID=2937791 RepID=A0A9X1YDA1_9PROT|nr:ABC transporter substrate-binding protein [Roseomonas acroporae]MCK8787672.1 ABC transporter substrate-binding protein [Roseomonas acroporae]
MSKSPGRLAARTGRPRTALFGAALAIVAALGGTGPARAQISGDVVRIGVISDMNGPYAPNAGEGSVIATRVAVEDCLRAECVGMRIEVLQADHQNRADLAVAIARRWMDQDGVDALGDMVNASVQLALQGLLRERGRVVGLFPGGTTRITNEDCSPETSVQWMWDTYSQVAASVRPLATPGSRWFFITADYAFGHQLQADATAMITRLGGVVVGAARHPFPGTTDFSSLLLQAQASRAGFVAVANTGTDAVNTLKQAREFGLVGGRSRQQLVAMILSLPEIRSLGDAAAGTQVPEGFYWDLDDGTRAFAARFAAAGATGRPRSRRGPTRPPATICAPSPPPARTRDGRWCGGCMRCRSRTTWCATRGCVPTGGWCTTSTSSASSPSAPAATRTTSTNSSAPPRPIRPSGRSRKAPARRSVRGPQDEAPGTGPATRATRRKAGFIDDTYPSTPASCRGRRVVGRAVRLGGGLPEPAGHLGRPLRAGRLRRRRGPRAGAEDGGRPAGAGGRGQPAGRGRADRRRHRAPAPRRRPHDLLR